LKTYRYGFWSANSRWSVVDLTVKTVKWTSSEIIKAAFKKASEGSMKGVLAYTDELVVFQDFLSHDITCIFDVEAAIKLNSTFFKFASWYDHEFGYSNK
jgi:glyceraldehyde 3-phosphate dehydrogenase